MKLLQDFTRKSIQWLGSPAAFNLGLAGIVLWLALGPALRYSEDWQLWINTSTTILTFVFTFLLQAAQRRHARRLQLKLDELIRAYRVLNARQRLIKLEEAPEPELQQLAAEFKALAERAQQHGR